MQWSLSLSHAVRPSIRPSAYLALSVLAIDAQCGRTLDMAWLLATGAPEINTRLYRICMQSKYYKAVATKIILLNYHHDGSWHVAATPCQRICAHVHKYTTGRTTLRRRQSHKYRQASERAKAVHTCSPSHLLLCLLIRFLPLALPNLPHSPPLSDLTHGGQGENAHYK